MKSKRRHELQENILAQEIGRIADFLKVHGNHIATGALIVAILVFGYMFLNRRAQGKQLQLQQQWTRAMSGNLKPDERTSALTALAEQADNKRVAALASVELGFEYAKQLLAARDNSQKSALAEKASQWYQLTIQKFPKEELAVAKAHYGLGKLSEAAGDFKKAGEEYRLARASEDLVDQPVVQLADLSVQRLKELESAKVRMAATAPATRPAAATTAPATAPATPATAPATAPAKAPEKATPAKTQPATPDKASATAPAGKAGK